MQANESVDGPWIDDQGQDLRWLWHRDMIPYRSALLLQTFVALMLGVAPQCLTDRNIEAYFLADKLRP